MSSIWDKVTYPFTVVSILTWDAGLAVINAVAPKKAEGSVVEAGKPGHHGQWPPYQPPKATDSRSACPALNAMANHGILPRDGKNIPFKLMTSTIQETYNFGGPFCYFVPLFSARMLKKDYATGTFDLADLSLHNGIEHDGSLTRYDVAQCPNQAVPAPELVEELLASASGKNGELTVADLSRALGKRRAQSRANNPHFTTSKFHDIFGSSNSATMLTIFGGNVPDLRVMLLDERIPDNWESRCRDRMGLTMAKFNFTVLPVELGVKEDPEAAKAKRD